MDEQGPKIRALREALGLTQAQVTQRLGVAHAPNWVLRAEKRDGDPNVNQLSHDDSKETLARGLGLTLADFKSYLSGRISVNEAVKRSSSAPGVEQMAPAIRGQTEDAASPLERALGHAFDPRRHILTDLRAVQDSLEGTHRWERPESDMIEAARTWLDAAAALRRAGQRVDAVAILDRVTFGRSDRSRQVAAEREAAVNAEGDVGADALDRPAPPHAIARALGYRLSPTAPSGCRGVLEVATATIRYDGRGSPAVVQRRLAHELAHVAALLADVSAPHAEGSVERIAAAIVLPRPAVRAAVARVGLDPTRLLAELPGWAPWVLLRAGWVSRRAVIVRAGGARWAYAPDGLELPEGAWEREVAAIVRRTGRPHRDLLGAEAWPVEVEGVMGVAVALVRGNCG